MNGHQQARLQHRAKARLSFTGAGKGLSIGLLIVLIVSVMIAWFGFLGWGLIGCLRSVIGFAKQLW